MDRSAVLATKIRAAFAPCRLGTWPAPLDAHPALARALGLEALWLKREDLAGGNKVRGLEFLLAGAPARSVFVTAGGTGSSHCLATARAAKHLGHRTALALFPQPETDASSQVSRAMADAADLVMRASSIATLPWALLRVWRAAHRIAEGRHRVRRFASCDSRSRRRCDGPRLRTSDRRRRASDPSGGRARSAT